jgi:signal transduction histidine kinase
MEIQWQRYPWRLAVTNADIAQSGRYGRRQVWLLTATGLSAGVVTLLVVWVTQHHIVVQRNLHDQTRDRLTEAVSTLDKIRAFEHDQILAQLANRPIRSDKRPDAGADELRDRLNNSVQVVRAQRGTVDSELLSGLQNAERTANALREVKVRAGDWRTAHSATSQRFRASLAMTRSIFSDLRNSIDRLEGNRRLTVAMKLRTFTQAQASDEASLAHDVIEAFESETSFQAWKGELADLAVFVEQLVASSDPDTLVDLKDNGIKPTLTRLRQTVPEANLASELSRFETALLGEGFVIDQAHQTIVPGTNGLFPLKQSMLNLDKARARIAADAEICRISMRAAVRQLEAQSSAAAQNLAEESERALMIAWLTIFVVGVFCVVVFLFLARKIARTITLQIDTIAEKSKELSQAQRLESIGALAAGIAHEINTPMQFVSDNIEFLDDCSRRLFEVVDAYEHNLSTQAQPKTWEVRWAELGEVIQRNQFPRIRQQIPQAISESREGIDRVISIVRAMKEFSHPEDEIKVSVDLNNAVKSAATITRNRWKFVARMDLVLDPDLPTVRCIPGEIHQVLLNLIVNAADAIAEKNGPESDQLGTISIHTRCTNSHVTLEVTDTGCGIPEDIRSRVFDQFFTTKDVGKGTGQGLAICFNIVVTKHQGTLDVSSTEGVGSTFRVTLPVGEASDEESFDDRAVAQATAEDSRVSHDEMLLMDA